MTSGQGETSLTIDAATGAVHALLNDQDGLVYVTRRARGPWMRQVLDNFQSSAPVIRRDARTGALLVAYLGSLGDQPHTLVIQRP